jgi:hypothetical protein
MAIRDALGRANVFGLQTLRALLDDERDAGPFIERTIAASGDGGKMDEDVFAILALDKSKSFSRVKPLYCACFFHLSSLPNDPYIPALSIEDHAEVYDEIRSTFSGFQTTREDSRPDLV